jgi:hypothetical protein
MSTGSTKASTDTNKQRTFSMETGDYIRGRADKTEEPGGYKYEDLALPVGAVSNLRQ